MGSKLFKRLTAGALALLMLGTALPSGTDFTGLFGSEITASADVLPSVIHDNGYGDSETITLKPENFDGSDSIYYRDKSFPNDLPITTDKGGAENVGRVFFDTVLDIPMTLYDGDGNTVALTEYETGELYFTPDASKTYYLVRDFVTANSGKWDYDKTDFVPTETHTVKHSNDAGNEMDIELVADNFNEGDEHIYTDMMFGYVQLASNDKSTQTGVVVVNQDIGIAVYDAAGTKAKLTKIAADGGFNENSHDCYTFPALQGFDYFVVKTKSNKCGEFAFWEFDSETGKLTISGTGAMYDYGYEDTDYAEETPWNEYKDSITEIAVSEGITTIGENAFFMCENLNNVVIPSTVKVIGGAFCECTSLTDFSFAEGSKL